MSSIYSFNKVATYTYVAEFSHPDFGGGCEYGNIILDVGNEGHKTDKMVAIEVFRDLWKRHGNYYHTATLTLYRFSMLNFEGKFCKMVTTIEGSPYESDDELTVTTKVEGAA